MPTKISCSANAIEDALLLDVLFCPHVDELRGPLRDELSFVVLDGEKVIGMFLTRCAEAKHKEEKKDFKYMWMNVPSKTHLSNHH
jgi:predicted N-acetyltransferase YhbS